MYPPVLLGNLSPPPACPARGLIPLWPALSGGLPSGLPCPGTYPPSGLPCPGTYLPPACTVRWTPLRPALPGDLSPLRPAMPGDLSVNRDSTNTFDARSNTTSEGGYFLFVVFISSLLFEGLGTQRSEPETSFSAIKLIL